MFRSTFKQVIFFTAIGLLGAMVDFGSYFFLTYFFAWCREHYVLTSVFTSLLTITVNFINNRRWTFRGTSGWPVSQYVRFLLVYGFSVVFQNSLLAFFVEFAELHYLISKLVSIVIVAYGWNFPVAKFWVFRYTGTEAELVKNDLKVT